MTKWSFNGPAWPLGDEWPAGALPPPVVTLEIAGPELEALIAHHDAQARECGERHEHNVELFHLARASYLRQRLAAVAPHRLTPDRFGTA